MADMAVIQIELVFAILRYCKNIKRVFTQAGQHSKLSSMITKIDVDVLKL